MCRFWNLPKLWVLRTGIQGCHFDSRDLLKAEPAMSLVAGGKERLARKEKATATMICQLGLRITFQDDPLAWGKGRMDERRSLSDNELAPGSVPVRSRQGTPVMAETPVLLDVRMFRRRRREKSNWPQKGAARSSTERPQAGPSGPAGAKRLRRWRENKRTVEPKKSW